LARTLQKSNARTSTRSQIKPPAARLVPPPAQQGMEHRAVMRRIQNRLAPGRQTKVEWRHDRPVLVQPTGTVQLNDSAAAILELCDGTRTADEVIAAFLSQPGRQELANDVREFIEAALQRGWIIEA
jgi:coenzyme PQQ biosynthesis protein PqqD